MINVSEGGKKEYSLVPAATYPAICVDVVDNGWAENFFDSTKKRRQIEICWLLDEINPENDEKYKIKWWYTASLDQKANLRKLLVSWRGKDFTDNELKKFDLETIIGADCLLNVTQYQKTDGDMRSKVESAIKPMAGHKKIVLKPDEYTRIKDGEKYLPNILAEGEIQCFVLAEDVRELMQDVKDANLFLTQTGQVDETGICLYLATQGMKILTEDNWADVRKCLLSLKLNQGDEDNLGF